MRLVSSLSLRSHVICIPPSSAPWQSQTHCSGGKRERNASRGLGKRTSCCRGCCRRGCTRRQTQQAPAVGCRWPTGCDKLPHAAAQLALAAGCGPAAAVELVPARPRVSGMRSHLSPSAPCIARIQIKGTRSDRSRSPIHRRHQCGGAARSSRGIGWERRCSSKRRFVRSGSGSFCGRWLPTRSSCAHSSCALGEGASVWYSGWWLVSALKGWCAASLALSARCN